ncbi:Arc family DNA-binding protein [Nitratireductor aquimarinus]|uniref:Arc family DNA-binding protein n=1 Tax=Nitratireductor aquimarinus TaxID=889300 RepID=A0ABU4AJ99_9HYPH|nr:Arc family DNA-binding protein [Nitratireductor aquimarinus]MDV6226314.1 Arc family DNA-binding protein [Nitratireductor aquimarinus]
MTEERKPMANIPPFGLRMQPDLKAQVEEAARANNRSLNAEIVSRLERSFVVDREQRDWEKLKDFYTADERYIVDEYFSGKTTDPTSGVKGEKLETDLVKQINRIISKRTEIMGEVIAREFDKRGMLTAPGNGERASRHVTPEEMKALQNAPPDIMPKVLECLSRKDVDAALAILEEARKKGEG